MKTISPFPKIFHIGEEYISNLFKGEVEITEKVDGSQWSFGINEDGEVLMRSKGQDLTYQDVPKMFEKAKEQVERMIPILEKKKLKNIVFYCEYLAKPKHNICAYGRIPKNNLYLFGVKEGQGIGSFVSDYKEIVKYADLLEIERPHLIYSGLVKDAKEVNDLLETDSILEKQKVEGLVIKNYTEPAGKGGFMCPISMGKYVSETFKEKHKTEWKRGFTSRGRLEVYFESFKTEARWQKAIQHLRENNELENAPRDIGKLMKEIERDLKEEESDNIKNELYKIFIGDIIRKTRRGFPEFYKELLAKKAFKNKNEI